VVILELLIGNPELVPHNGVGKVGLFQSPVIVIYSVLVRLASHIDVRTLLEAERAALGRGLVPLASRGRRRRRLAFLSAQEYGRIGEAEVEEKK
jgi:hypothetical protein